MRSGEHIVSIRTVQTCYDLCISRTNPEAAGGIAVYIESHDDPAANKPVWREYEVDVKGSSCVEHPCCRERSFIVRTVLQHSSVPPSPHSYHPMDTTTTTTSKNQIETRPMTSCDAFNRTARSEERLIRSARTEESGEEREGILQSGEGWGGEERRAVV